MVVITFTCSYNGAKLCIIVSFVKLEATWCCVLRNGLCLDSGGHFIFFRSSQSWVRCHTSISASTRTKGESTFRHFMPLKDSSTRKLDDGKMG